MRERPILFSGPMVRAILAGTKTQTRRVMKPQPSAGPGGLVGLPDRHLIHHVVDSGPADWYLLARCPYGAPGDRLWVREAWAPCEYLGREALGRPLYRASFPPIADERHDFGLITEPKCWRPAIHMPRRLSRLLLEVVDVRVQRVCEISLDDARAEGIPQTGAEAHELGLHDMNQEPGHEWDNRTSVENFSRLWDRINGKRRVPTSRWQAIPGPATDVDTSHSWAANPRAWAITFRRLEPA